MSTDIITFQKGFKPHLHFKNTWIKEKIDENCIKFMEDFGLFLCDKISINKHTGREEISDRAGEDALTTSQIRNVFGEIKRIEMKLGGNSDDAAQKIWDELKPSFLLLKPKLAYNTARVTQKSSKSKYNRIVQLKDVLFLAHSEVKDVKQFYNFSQFMEGILAFHKAYGGKD